MASETIMEPMDLRVRELLKEVKLEHSPAFTKLVNDAVSALRDSIDKIPQDLQVSSELAPGFVKDIGADKVDFRFKRPKSIEIGGSYSIHCIAKPDVNLDLYVPLPKECFHEKDYLNHRYHAKRFLYLCVIKKYISSSPLVHKVEWSTLQNEARKPVLTVYPATKLDEAPGFCVRLIPTATSLFNISKLNPERNNVRAVNQGGDLVATPKYNSSILEDMVMEDIAESVKKVFLGWEELQEALVLLKVWGRQRTSIYTHDCLSGFLLSVILCNLANSGEIIKSMRAMQIVRIAYGFIASPRFLKHGIRYQMQGQKAVSKEVSKEENVEPKKQIPYDLAFRMTKIGCIQVQDEAATTLRCMDKCRDGGFEEIYMTKIDFPTKYDLCIRLNLKDSREIYTSGFCLDDECWRLYEQKVQNVLVEGLSDRVKLVRVIWKNTPSNCIIEDGLSAFSSEPLLIGVSVSSLEKAYRVIDIGPNPLNKEEALKYRKFWGEKAELRRFKDGTIAESTFWSCEPWKRRLILKNISDYVLARHLSIPKANITLIVDQLDFSLVYGATDPMSFSASLLKAFEEFSKRLRLIQDIPLKIATILPLDSAFRSTSVFPPEPHPLANEKSGGLRPSKFTPTCIQPLEVMIQLEGSGNWPMDEVAIEKTKCAFLLQIGQSLENNWGIRCSATEDNVDVFMSGYAFRLKIWHERGLSLLKTGSNQHKKVSSVDTELFFRSQHSSMINGLQGRFPVYGQVSRLAKRWVASHLFSSCLREEAIELLVAHLFLKPIPYDIPCSRITGFLRFLRLVSNYDWAFSPLIVDINSDLGPSAEKEIIENFMSTRKSCGANEDIEPAMFLATAYDKLSEAWTRFSPCSSELKRLVAYAQSSANVLTKLALEDHSDSRWECLLRTPLNNFDAVTLLHREKLAYPQRLLFPSELRQGTLVARGTPSKFFHPFLLPGDFKGNLEDIRMKLMVDFDPLKCFLGDLEDFSDTFKIWYDSYGGDAIGFTWGTRSKKRGQEEASDEAKSPSKLLKAVGVAGKGFIRSVYLLRSPRPI